MSSRRGEDQTGRAGEPARRHRDREDTTVTAEALFWDLAEAMDADPAVSRSTMMGLPCLRHHGRFFASLDRTTRALLVKLPRERVQQLVRDGHGQPFAPAGRVFREWVAVADPDERRWRSLLDEAKAHAAGDGTATRRPGEPPRRRRSP
jgi:hypothetical protein